MERGSENELTVNEEYRMRLSGVLETPEPRRMPTGDSFSLSTEDSRRSSQRNLSISEGSDYSSGGNSRDQGGLAPVIPRAPRAISYNNFNLMRIMFCESQCISDFIEAVQKSLEFYKFKKMREIVNRFCESCIVICQVLGVAEYPNVLLNQSFNDLEVIFYAMDRILCDINKRFPDFRMPVIARKKETIMLVHTLSLKIESTFLSIKLSFLGTRWNENLSRLMICESRVGEGIDLLLSKYFTRYSKCKKRNLEDYESITDAFDKLHTRHWYLISLGQYCQQPHVHKFSHFNDLTPFFEKRRILKDMRIIKCCACFMSFSFRYHSIAIMNCCLHRLCFRCAEKLSLKPKWRCPKCNGEVLSWTTTKMLKLSKKMLYPAERTAEFLLGYESADTESDTLESQDPVMIYSRSRPAFFF